MSSSAAIEHFYQYPYLSELADQNGTGVLKLATSRFEGNYPYFFEGRLLQPRALARLLTTVSKLVATRFYTPPGMLANILAAADPVVTSGGGMLRFEGFSSCCSAYARVDVTPDAYNGKIVGQGTTNVDFNAPMRAALARVRDHDQLSISVGPDEVALKRGFERTIEKKVTLPLRWLKGFVEVQAYQSTLHMQFDVGQAETLKFLRSLPRNADNRSVFWLVPAGKGLRLSQAATKEGARVAGLDRLRMLQDLAPMADRLQIFVHPFGEASEWILRCGPLSFHLTVSADVSRGFSGEGQVLTNLAKAEDEGKLLSVKESLKWQSIIRMNEISQNTGLEEDTVRSALATLGSRGLVGFDVGSASYFHREMPFDMNLVNDMHPRLKSAKKIIDDKGLRIIQQTQAMTEAEVQGTGVTHRVKISDSSSSCTCQWHAKYQNARGPCKHIIAVQMMSD